MNPNEAYLSASASLGGRVLVVDNEEQHRSLMTDRLSAVGYTVQMASDGLEALQVVTAFNPEAILLDVMMPHLDGLETCRRLKSDPSTVSIPVLLTTARSGRVDRLRGIQAGASDFLVKPLDIEEVCLRVKNAVHAKQRYDLMHAAHEQLRRRQELRDNLTQFVVHDLRSPLTEIMVNLDLLKMGYLGSLNAQQKKGVGTAYSVSQQLLEMINSLLDVARMENDRMPLRMEPCELRLLVREALVVLGPLLDCAQVNLDLPPNLPLVVCDGRVIQRVLVNLLDNAAKYVSSGGSITVSAQLVVAGSLAAAGASGKGPRREQGGSVAPLQPGVPAPALRIGVTDTGLGVPFEYQDRIFDKFAQVDPQLRKAKYSSGLGLTFCKLAVDAHGGHIGVESPAQRLTPGSRRLYANDKGSTSKAGPGSTFWFTLPVWNGGS